MRRMVTFACEAAQLVGTIDEGKKDSGLLIVSGGNEIRSGAHAGQAAMAGHFAAMGYPVFRYDRRGIGDSQGDNGGFLTSGPDIAAAISCFRSEAPRLHRIVAWGNCDAATALALFHQGLGIDSLALANPWVIENSGDEEGPTPPAAAIRARYWNRLKNPQSLIDLFSGRINLRTLAAGLAKAATSEKPTGLAVRLANALATIDTPCRLLLAERDTTALAFMSAWNGATFARARANKQIIQSAFSTASHSFADAEAKIWLLEQIGALLRLE